MVFAKFKTVATIKPIGPPTAAEIPEAIDKALVAILNPSFFFMPSTKVTIAGKALSTPPDGANESKPYSIFPYVIYIRFFLPIPTKESHPPRFHVNSSRTDSIYAWKFCDVF